MPLCNYDMQARRPGRLSPSNAGWSGLKRPAQLLAPPRRFATLPPRCHHRGVSIPSSAYAGADKSIGRSIWPRGLPEAPRRRQGGRRSLREVEAALAYSAGGDGVELVRAILSGSSIEQAARANGAFGRRELLCWGWYFRHALDHLAVRLGYR
jgi:hypothetical protein